MIEAGSHNDDKGDLARDDSSLAQREPSVATILQEERDHRQSDDLERPRWRTKLRNLYVGTDKRATRFQRAIASVDLVIVAFFILSPVI